MHEEAKPKPKPTEDQLRKAREVVQQFGLKWKKILPSYLMPAITTSWYEAVEILVILAAEGLVVLAEVGSVNYRLTDQTTPNQE